ncbi:tRNA (adenosine(37)-N6)-threonylcarbamoyltransferase complex dimerization subunit type 1 TsaB [Nitratidesulfovibrio sp. D1]|uniref:tRNA (adenosine(37)-N6)-threonylcarbamoyltransferase complex dimerization subunit type 1 TsaB n=1 Tax=Nitratidesulfovibrio sp. D1 TaxID=3440151 RepID=UPI003EB800A9
MTQMTPATGLAETTGAITLALNAAESRVQAAALRDGETLFAQEWHVPSQGTELLAPALADAFERMRLSLRDVRRIACVQGPGSFTGLRLALSTAAGMARALGARQAGLSYTQLLACGPLLPRGAVLWVLTHARRGLVHMQAFRMPGETADAADLTDIASAAPSPLPEALTPVEAAMLDAAVARMAAFQSGTGNPAAGSDNAAPPVYLMGSGATRNRAALAPALAALLPGARFLPARFDHPAPALLLPLAATAAYGPGDVQPLYVRPCDAEENLPALAAARGMDPDQARRELARLTSAPLADATLTGAP